MVLVNYILITIAAITTSFYAVAQSKSQQIVGSLGGFLLLGAVIWNFIDQGWLAGILGVFYSMWVYGIAKRSHHA